LRALELVAEGAGEVAETLRLLGLALPGHP
jgi:hypothetical protein